MTIFIEPRSNRIGRAGRDVSSTQVTIRFGEVAAASSADSFDTGIILPPRLANVTRIRSTKGRRRRRFVFPSESRAFAGRMPTMTSDINCRNELFTLCRSPRDSNFGREKVLLVVVAF